MDIINNPLVSVIIPTYNRTKFLKEALNSVVNQTYPKIEIIVIDDGSKNEDAEIICKEFNKCKYYYKKNGGLSSARNYGIIKAKGELIAFLDDDDFWHYDKIRKQVALLNEFKDVDCIHSSAKVVNEAGEFTGEIIGAAQNKINKRSGNVFWNALGVWVVKSPTPLIRKSVFKKDMVFDETIKVGEDIDFYQRLFYRHKIHYINEPLGFYRIYNDKERLSTQVEKYIGIEKKMFQNFLEMGIKNPLILHAIAIKLVSSAYNKRNTLFRNEINELSFIQKFITPIKMLEKINELQ